MHALSVKQPYAERIASGEKTREYRTWAPRAIVGRDLLIVASRTPAPGGEGLPVGVAICVVHVEGIGKTDDGYAWRLARPRRVAPVELRGRAALFTVDDDQIMTVGAPSAPDTRRAVRIAPAPAAYLPYAILAGKREIARAALPAEARQIARRESAARRTYVRIERDGYEIGGEPPPGEPDPDPEPEPGDRFTFAIRGCPIHGSEATEHEARATAATLRGFYHGAPITILLDGERFAELPGRRRA